MPPQTMPPSGKQELKHEPVGGAVHVQSIAFHPCPSKAHSQQKTASSTVRISLSLNGSNVSIQKFKVQHLFKANS